MRILLSAFGFGPGEGSESGGAWRWANELAKEHDVVVVTDGHNRQRIGELVERLKHPRLTVLYFRPWWNRRMKVTTLTSHFVFGQWQFGLLFLVRQLHRQQPFDVCHHISYGSFRQASWLGFAGPPFVFGPVGGGEDAPWRFKRSFPRRELLREVLRAVANALAVVNPLWRWALSRADLVFARTEETRARLPATVRARTVVAQEIGAPARELPRCSGPALNQPIRLLFAGRLLAWKGPHLAVRALAALRDRGVDADLTLVGRGPMRSHLEALGAGLRLGERLRFIDFVRQEELFRLYATANVFIFPSLHDSGGNVVQEALSAGLPVVCLKLGGPPEFVDDRSGVVVPVHDAADEHELVQRLAAAVQSVTGDLRRWKALHEGAIARADELTWERQIKFIYGEIERTLRLSPAHCRSGSGSQGQAWRR